MSSEPPTGRIDDPEATAVVGEDEDVAPVAKEKGLSVGELVGRYVLVGEVGRGAMGRVYRAYDPRLSREVALKVLGRPKKNAAETAQRVIREAQALAKLNHPNVVAVYDVGQSDKRYYIAMELVLGANLSDWLAKEARSWREVLDVMLGAGRGLAAAHAAGLVHRDLKPGNILVGDDGRVRVTDFGLARGGVFTNSSSVGSIAPATHDIEDALTEMGTILGTPAYMPPEQHRGRQLDGRSDAYAFCLTLWEAITGNRPFTGRSPKELLENKITASLRWPASKPAWLGTVLTRGLAPEPEARYPTMDALLDALDRDPTRWRRRLVIGTAVVAGLGLLVGGASFMARRAPSACGDADVQLAGVWDEARRSAVAAGFIAGAPEFGEAVWPRLSAALDDWADRWLKIRAAECAGDSGLPAHLAMQRAVCLARHKQQFDALVGVFAEADAEVVERSMTAATRLPRPEACEDPAYLSAAVPPPDDPAIARRVDDVRKAIARGRALLDAGRIAPARDALHTALEQARDLEHEPLIGEALAATGLAEWTAGDHARAEQDLEAAYETLIAVGDDEKAASTAIRLTALVGDINSRHAEGHRWGRHAEALIRRADLGSDLVSGLAAARGSVYQDQSDFAAARAAQEKAIELAVAVDGEDSHRATTYRGNLANTLTSMGRLDEALALHQTVLAQRRTSRGDAHPDVAETLTNLAGVQIRQSDYQDAVATLTEAMAILESSVGTNHPHYATALSNLGIAYRHLGKGEKALECYERALETFETIHGPDHVLVGTTAINLGNRLWALGRAEEADEYFRRALTILEGAYGRKHPKVASALNARGIALHSMGRSDEALELLREALTILEERVGPDHLEVGRQANNIGTILLRQGKAAEARPLLERAHGIRVAGLGETDPTVAGPLTNLGDLEREEGDSKTAMQHYQRAIALVENGLGKEHRDLIHPLCGLGHLHFASGELGPAVKAYERAIALGLDDAYDDRLNAEVQKNLAEARRRLTPG